MRGRVDRCAQRHVDGHQHDLELLIGQHHAHRRCRLPWSGGTRLQQLGMARERHAGQRQRFLVNRRGDERAADAAH
jgi:hypothetical protein